MTTTKIKTPYKDKASAKLSMEARKAELFKAGYTVIGEGSRAIAFVHPKRPNRVIRIAIYDGREPIPSRPYRDGWLLYYTSFAGSRSKHFPKVFSVTLHRRFYEVEMERLRLDADRAWAGIHYATEGGIPSFRKFLNRIHKVRNNYNHGKPYESRVANDLGGQNVLIRPKTGDLVVTDPFAI